MSHRYRTGCLGESCSPVANFEVGYSERDGNRDAKYKEELYYKNNTGTSMIPGSALLNIYRKYF